jgi:hypothetical protein
LFTFATYTGMELPSHFQPQRQSVQRFYEAYGIRSPGAALVWYHSSAEFGYPRRGEKSSSDGLRAASPAPSRCNVKLDCSGGGGSGSGSGLHWDEYTGKHRVAKVMRRMQGSRERLEKMLLG